FAPDKGRSHPKGPLHGGSPLQYQCTFSKTGTSAFLSQLEFVETLRRAVSRADLPVRFSQGFHPQPRIAFGPGMPVGQEMKDQLFTIELEAPIDPVFLQESLNAELPEGLFIENVSLIAQRRPFSPENKNQPAL